jgi:acyl-CoA-dependent ceramide synthase
MRVLSAFHSFFFKLLLLPVILYLNWENFTPYVGRGLPNPFHDILFLSNPIPSTPGDQRYAKSYYDLLFVAYYTVFWSFARATIMKNMCRPVAK